MSKVRNIPFSVSARTARLIGRENVSNAEAAIIELLKNSYDADAPSTKIIFDEDNLYIIDNGDGMTEEVIRSNWMVIGTNNKETSPQSRKGRVKSGAKGIGRFALDRLGKNVIMSTKIKGADNALRWTVNWSSFEDEEKTVDKVEATLDDIPITEYEKLLRKLDFDAKDHGTILHIRGLRDDWSERNLDRLYQALESLVPTDDQGSFTVDMRATAHPGKYGKVESLITNDYDYELRARYNHKTLEVDVEISRNEFDIRLLEKKYRNVFKEKGMSTFPYDEETFKTGNYNKVVPIAQILNGEVDEAALQAIGDFSFQIIFAKNKKPNNEDVDKYPYRTLDYSTRAEWMKKFGGIRIYRDNFRVRPYGEKGDDWLRLGERQAQSPGGPGQRLGGYKVRPNQVTGGIYISRLLNESLADKSSREGIVENDSFELLKNIIKGIIGILEDDRNMVFYSLSNLYKKTNQSELVKARGKKIVADIKANEQKDEKNWSSGKEETETLVDLVGILESEGKDKDEEIRILRSLASAGLITAAAAHELKGFRNHLNTRNNQLRDLIGRYIKEEEMGEVRSAFNPFVQIDHMKSADESISGWLDYALMPLRRDRRTRSKFNLKDYFKDLSQTWESLLLARKIKLSVQFSDSDDNFTVRLFPIDLDTIFNNLIINSVESFSRQSKIDSRKITIRIDRKADKIVVSYSDNGAGLDSSLTGNPDRIFMPQVTTKLDMAGNPIGTGMGMYLVKSVVDENYGSVDLVPVITGFSILIEFGAKS